MKFIGIAILATVATALTPPFQVKLVSSDNAVNGRWLNPQLVATDGVQIYWSYADEKPAGDFQLEMGRFKYNTPGGNSTYGSAGMYDFPGGLPILSFRDEHVSGKGIPTGFEFGDHEYLQFNGRSEFYTCDYVSYPGQDPKTTVCFFNNAQHDGCHPVSLKYEGLYN